MATGAKEPRLAQRKPGGRGSAAMPPIDDPEAITDDQGQVAKGPLIEIPLDKLHDHPGNPESTEAEILEMMLWLQEGEQDEPITVRPLAEPIGHYEVLAGKRRKAAATRLGWDTLEARIRRDLADDRDAAAFAARNNIERRTEGDLRKAHWLRYQVEQLGMTVADSATAMGMSQGNASNLMSVAELCDKRPYWRDLIIAGEMSAAHLRPLKKYRDYPAVMKLLEKDHAEGKAKSTTQTWLMEEYIAAWGTRESIEYTVTSIIEGKTCALRFEDTIGDERAYDEPKFDANKLTPAQHKKLKVVSIPAPGDKSDRTVERCFDVKAWRVLQESARNAKSKQAADRSSKTASATAKRERTPAEQKKLDQQRAKHLTERIRGWRHAWLKRLVADRIDTGHYRAIVERMRAWLQSEPFSGIVAGELDLAGITIREAGGKPPQYRSSKAVWHAVSTLPIDRITALSENLVIAILRHEDKDHRYPRLDFDHVEDLARMAGIDVAAEWAAMQRGTKPVEFETFFLLHDKSQLERVSLELKVNIHGLGTKKQLVARLIGQPRALPLPKSVSTLATKKPRGKK